MEIIYEPRGKAREYAKLALNVRKTCEHACVYCFAPRILRMSKEDFFRPGVPVSNLFERLKKDLKKLSTQNNYSEVLISFIADPYQPVEMEHPIMPSIIKMFLHYEVPFTILTKGGTRIVRDFDLLLQAGNKFRFGTTLSFYHDWIARRWEPYAASTDDRFQALKLAKEQGMRTWVSVEPIIDTDEALQIMAFIHKYVDHFSIGKINHMPELEKGIDWVRFRDRVVVLMETIKADYYIKESLREL